MAARRYSRRDIHFEIWVSRATRLMAGSGRMFVMHSASVSSNPCWTPTPEHGGYVSQSKPKQARRLMIEHPAKLAFSSGLDDLQRAKI